MKHLCTKGTTCYSYRGGMGVLPDQETGLVAVDRFQYPLISLPFLKEFIFLLKLRTPAFDLLPHHVEVMVLGQEAGNALPTERVGCNLWSMGKNGFIIGPA